MNYKIPKDSILGSWNFLFQDKMVRSLGLLRFYKTARNYSFSELFVNQGHLCEKAVWW